MRIQFLGAAQEVTGSLILLETAEGNLVIDCGLFQGRRQEARQRNRALPPEAPARRRGAALARAHRPRGHLPTLVSRGSPARSGRRRPPATCARHAARLGPHPGKRRRIPQPRSRRRPSGPIEPLYDEADAVARHRALPASPTARRFRRCRACAPASSTPATSSARPRWCWTSTTAGGACASPSRATSAAGACPSCATPSTAAGRDAVVMECTYGNRLHGSVEQTHGDLERVVKETAPARRARCIVPAFAVGRTQELIYSLAQLWRRGAPPAIPCSSIRRSPPR